jgi:hypothetical protein
MAEAQANASLQLTMNASDNASSVVGNVTSVLNNLQGAIGAAGLAAVGAFAASIEPTLQYAETLQRVKAVAGLTANETARLLAGFGAAGIGADEAAPMIQRLEMRLGRLADSAANAGEKGNSASRMFETLGIKIRDAHGNAIPMSTLLPEIIDRLNQIPDPMQRAALASSLFGKNYGSLAPLLALGGAGFKAAMEDASRFGLEIGEHGVEEGHKFRAEQSKMNEALLGLKVMLGLYIIPYVTTLFTWVENLIAGFQSWSPPVKEMIVNFLGLIAIFGTLLGGAAAVGGALSAVSGVLGPLGAAVAALSAPMLAFLGVLGIIAAGILAVVYAYNNFASVHRALAPIVQQITTFWNNLGDAVQFFISSIRVIGPINALGGALKIMGMETSNIIRITDTLQRYWDQVAAVVNRVRDAVSTAIGVWRNSHDVLATVATVLTGLGVNYETITNIINIIRLVQSTLTNDWRQLSTTLLPALQRALGNVTTGLSALGPVFRTLLPLVGLLAGALGVGLQLVIQILIAVLPPAIVIASTVFMALATSIAVVVDWVNQHQGVVIALAAVIGAVLLPTLIALAIQFSVNLVTGIIATIQQVTAATIAWGLQNAQMIINNVQLSAYLVRMGAVAIAQGAVRAATIAWTIVQWLLNVALDANPISLIIIAIAALVAGIIYAYNNSETFRNIVNALWAGLKVFASWIWASLKPILDWLGGALHAIANAAGAALGAISNVTNIGGALHGIIPGFQTGAVLVGPGYGGQRLARVGEGTGVEVIGTMAQIFEAAKHALSASGEGGGDGGAVIPLTLTLDGQVLTRVVLRRAGKRWSLQAGRIGSGA